MITKEYSFWDLITTYDIEIPAIQRDYAQGRKSESRIAKALISDLHDFLTSIETKKINLLKVLAVLVSVCYWAAGMCACDGRICAGGGIIPVH